MIPDRVGICCGKSHSQKNKRKQIIMLNKDTNNVIMEFDGICNALRYLNKNSNNT